jgi:hypothetical protein
MTRKTVARAFMPATERERISVVEAIILPKKTVLLGKRNPSALKSGLIFA